MPSLSIAGIILGKRRDITQTLIGQSLTLLRLQGSIQCQPDIIYRIVHVAGSLTQRQHATVVAKRSPVNDRLIGSVLIHQ